MGRYLDLANEALAHLERDRSGRFDGPEAPVSPSTHCDKSDISDKRVSNGPLSPWADPQDPNVQAARAEAERLRALGKSPRDFDLEPQWIIGDALARLPEQLQGLVCPREGWTPASWASYLRIRAGRCDQQHRDLADLYERAARLLDSQGGRDRA